MKRVSMYMGVMAVALAFAVVPVHAQDKDKDKNDAENVVKGIEGVTRVDNQIEVLPLSSMDDGIRIAAYRTIFGKPGLDRYAMQAVPPIHIIVNNGKVTLEGVVATEGVKNQAGI